MTAGVSSMAWILSNSRDEGHKKHDLVTKDLLGSARWEHHLDMECSAPTKRQLLDLNSLPSSDSIALSLQMAPPAPASSAMCTLEKVRLALERVERESHRKPSSSSSTTTSSLKRRSVVEDGPESSSSTSSTVGEMIAVACNNCFMFVLVPKTEPRCPRCNSSILVLPTMKRPKIDVSSKKY